MGTSAPYVFRIAYDRNGAKEGRPWEVILTQARFPEPEWKRTFYCAKVLCVAPTQFNHYPKEDNINVAVARAEGIAHAYDYNEEQHFLRLSEE